MLDLVAPTDVCVDSRRNSASALRLLFSVSPFFGCWTMRASDEPSNFIA